MFDICENLLGLTSAGVMYDIGENLQGEGRLAKRVTRVSVTFKCNLLRFASLVTQILLTALKALRANIVNELNRVGSVGSVGRAGRVGRVNRVIRVNRVNRVNIVNRVNGGNKMYRVKYIE